ncbi:hypothetical protein DPMN_092698 [Dreissena polymorpha]|uniref:HBS1-like protein N-terminal domain-containing protein n=1 Tax=Dreissena polymorpha TaxID=45954 RepID=A0A9D4R1Y5_DREPO|nr:hypothetical protein DPMN_092698 [Dreissena polymorpha]
MCACVLTARLNSCLDEVRSVLGKSVPEHLMIEVILRHNFSIEGALNELLNQLGKGWGYRFGDGIEDERLIM